MILIVEDDEPLRQALSDKFFHEGFKVIIAKNGVEGLNLALKERPDLILLDIVMPVMDGMTMLRELRHNAWGATVKVIVLTNLTDQEELLVLSPMGSLNYIVKSNWKIADVVKKVKKVLS